MLVDALSADDLNAVYGTAASSEFSPYVVLPDPLDSTSRVLKKRYPHVHTHTRTHSHTCTHTCTHALMVFKKRYLHTHTHTHTHTWVHVHVHTGVCIYIYRERERERERERMNE